MAESPRPDRGVLRPYAWAFVLSLILAAAYIPSMGMRASRGAEITGDEPFYLLTTQSLLRDGDLDLTNQYEARSYKEFFDHPQGLWRQSIPTADGRLLSPHDPGLSVLLLPGFALGGLRGAQAQMLVIAAAAFALVFLLATRVTGQDLWSWLATLAVGLTPTAFVYATEVYPEMPAALLVAAGLLIMAGGKRPGGRMALAVAALSSSLVWLGFKYAPLAGMLAVYALTRASWTGRFTLIAATTVSAAVYAVFNLATFGGFSPYSVNVIYAGQSLGATALAHLEGTERAYRMWGIFLDQRFGLARWAPVLLPAVPALVLLGGRGAPIPRPLSPKAGKGGWSDLSVAMLLLIAAQLLVAAFVAVTMMGWWFPGRTMAAVLPLFALPLALLLARALPWVRAMVGLLGLLTAANTAGLALAAHASEVTVAVDPFAMSAPLFRWSAVLFPNYTAWTWHTWLATCAWLLVWACGAAALLMRKKGYSVTLKDARIPSR